MSGQKQHVDKFRKILLRQHLMGTGLVGAAYVPFIGDGDLAVELYSGLRIYGADLDLERVAVAQSRLPDAKVVKADCDKWPFPRCEEEFVLADFDAFSNPYKALKAFWIRARKEERVILFGTDGLRQGIKRNRATKRLPDGAETKATTPQLREQYNFWWPRFVLPWLVALVAPYTIVQEMKYLRRDMLYWGIVVDSTKA